MSLIKRAKKLAMERSRSRKLQRFFSLSVQGDNVLDVGVSSESKKGLPAKNYFLKNYRYAPETYTGLGVDDLGGMDKLFPGKRFVKYPGGRFPFSDKQFDWVFSNAVIEHVGDDNAKLLFLNEMMRVARNVFFTTPNKYFPVEAHTDVIMLHWNNALFHMWLKKHRPGWKIESLDLLSYHKLKWLLNASNATSFKIRRDRFMFYPMTFSCTCTDQ